MGSRPVAEGAIRRWAEARGIAGALRLTYPEANRLMPGAFGEVGPSIPGYLPLLDLIAERSNGLSYAGGQFEAFRQRVWAFLERQADNQAAALEGERREDLEGRPLPPGAADDPVHTELIQRMRSHRRRLRELVAPMPLGASEEPLVLHDDFPPAVSIQWPTRPVLGALFTRLPLVVEGRAGEVECRCLEPRACTHRLALVDRVLRALLFPEQSPIGEQLVALARVPKWQRLLDHLELVAEARPRTEAALYWELCEDRGLWTVRPLIERATKKQPAKPKRIAVDRLLEERRTSLSPIDLELARLVVAWNDAAKEHDPDQTLLGLLLRKLVGHPRLLLEGSDRAVTSRLGEACLVAHTDGVGTRFLIAFGDRRIEATEALDRRARGMIDDLLIDVDYGASKVELVTVDPKLWEAIELLDRADAVIPRAAQEEIVRRLPRLGHLGPIAIEGDVERRHVLAVRTVILRLSHFREEGLEVQVLIEPLAGAARVVPGQGPSELVASSADRELTFTRRLIRDEAIWVAERLRGLLPVEIGPSRDWVFQIAELDAALTLLSKLETEEGLVIEWDRGQGRSPFSISRLATPEDLRVQITTGADWLGLDGSVEVDGDRITVAALLAAARANRRFVKIDRDRFIAIGRALEGTADALDALVRPRKNGLELSPWMVPLAAELFAELPIRLEGSPRFFELAESANAAKAIDPEVPGQLGAILRPYQRDAFTWMARLSSWGVGALLADDMGLGKTLEALAILSWRKRGGPALVIAPTSVTYNWLREIEAFTPELRPILYRGEGRVRLLQGLGPGDLLIASYPLVARDAAVFSRQRFETLVLDEAHAIKNAASQRARAVRGIEAGWRLAMTGTPMENHLGELHALWRAIEPGLLGSWEEFKDRYVTPIHHFGDAKRRAALARLIRPFVLRRTKAEVARELPPRIEVRVDVELSAKERALYEDARLTAIAELSELEGVDLDRGRFHVLAALTRLRQLACHPRLADPTSTVSSSKLSTAIELLGTLVAAGQRVLVFSQFTRHLGLVAEALGREGIGHLHLDGSTPPDRRPDLIARFQAGEAPVFLISLKAGGTGINLTAAENVVHLDPWWNPAVEDQATDRAHRIGQDKPVTVYRLVTKGSIEEAILGLHADKRALADALLEGTSNAAKLDTHELIALIQGTTFSARSFEDEDPENL